MAIVRNDYFRGERFGLVILRRGHQEDRDVPDQVARDEGLKRQRVLDSTPTSETGVPVRICTYFNAGKTPIV